MTTRTTGSPTSTDTVAARPLRTWQRRALTRYLTDRPKDFLAVATPGAGKTTFALTAARHELAARPSRLVVVAPTAHLKRQWARAAAYNLGKRHTAPRTATAMDSGAHA